MMDDKLTLNLPRPSETRADDKSVPLQRTSRFSVREVIVDILGSLVPGFVFVVLLVPALGWPSFVLVRALGGNRPQDYEIVRAFASVLAQFHLELFVGLIALSYIVGHLFFRQDPKIPDEKSFYRVQKIIGETGPVRKEPETKAAGEDATTSGGPESVRNTGDGNYKVEFPYLYLHEYLTERGLTHLAALIPWRGNDKRTHPFRTKHFVNILKIRLEFLFPDRYVTVARNEAHVRLMTSGWYVTSSLKWVAFTGTLLGFAAYVVTAARMDDFWPIPNVDAILMPFIIVLASLTAKRQIERVVHYQRIREIIFVLEMAFWAQKYQPDLLDDLSGNLKTEGVLQQAKSQ